MTDADVPVDVADIQTIKDNLASLSDCVMSLRHLIRQLEIATGSVKVPMCSFCGNNPVYARGLCRNCYGRALSRGTPEYAEKRTNKQKEAAEAKREEKRNKLLNWQLEIARAVIPDLGPYSDLPETVEYVIKNLLTERECEVLISRYKDGKTLREIGRNFGLTQERIRQVEAKALRKLRHSSRSHIIQVGLEAIEREKTETQELKEKGIYDAINSAQKISLGNWGLSVRAYNCLFRASGWIGYTFNTVADLLIFLKDGHSFREIRNLGAQTEREIMEKLKADYKEFFDGLEE